MASIKGNIVLNGINTITGILFPVVTFPYAARVLLPEGIGAINFLNSIIGYIILMTTLGIPLYAVKEVAKYRDNKIERDKITVEILILSTALCILGYIAVWLLAKYVPQIHKQAPLFYILSLTILFTSIGVNWFYQGIEDFKFITIRAIIIRTLAASALFIFVKNSSDLLIYGMIVVGSTVGNNFINFVHLRKHIDIKPIRIRELEIGRHIRPTLSIFVLNLIISLYIQLNSIMLGFISGDEAVGFYTAGNKISHIGLTLIASLGTVLLPRCSNLLQRGDMEGFATVIGKSLNVTLLLSLPMTIGLMLLADPVTILFCGNDFDGAIPVLYITAPVIIFISLTNLMGIQILYPKNKITIVIWSVTGGAIANILLNILLIPHYGAFGAGISTFIAELTVLLLQIIFGYHYFPFRINNLLNWRIALSTVLMGLCVWISVLLLDNIKLKVIVGFFIGVLSYSAALLIFKEKLATEVALNFRNKILHH